MFGVFLAIFEMKGFHFKIYFIVQTGFSILKKNYSADGLLDILKKYVIVQTENSKNGQDILNLYFITPPPLTTMKMTDRFSKKNPPGHSL